MDTYHSATLVQSRCVHRHHSFTVTLYLAEQPNERKRIGHANFDNDEILLLGMRRHFNNPDQLSLHCNDNALHRLQYQKEYVVECTITEFCFR